MIKRASLLLMLAAFACVPFAAHAQAQTPSRLTVGVQTKGLPATYAGHLRVFWMLHGRRQSREIRAAGGQLLHFDIPSDAQYFSVEGIFAKNGGPTYREKRDFPHAVHFVTLDFGSYKLK